MPMRLTVKGQATVTDSGERQLGQDWALPRSSNQNGGQQAQLTALPDDEAQ